MAAVSALCERENDGSNNRIKRQLHGENENLLPIPPWAILRCSALQALLNSACCVRGELAKRERDNPRAAGQYLRKIDAIFAVSTLKKRHNMFQFNPFKRKSGKGPGAVVSTTVDGVLLAREHCRVDLGVV
jgi:hypothetical protein